MACQPTRARKHLAAFRTTVRVFLYWRATCPTHGMHTPVVLCEAPSEDKRLPAIVAAVWALAAVLPLGVTAQSLFLQVALAAELTTEGPVTDMCELVCSQEGIRLVVTATARTSVQLLNSFCVHYFLMFLQFVVAQINFATQCTYMVPSSFHASNVTSVNTDSSSYICPRLFTLSWA